MNDSVVEELLEFVVTFWVYSVRETEGGRFQQEPLDRVRENWCQWWDEDETLDETKRARIRRLTEQLERDEEAQTQFCDAIRKFIEKWCNRWGTGELVLAQLGCVDLFSGWASLHREQTVNAIAVLESLPPANGNDIQPLEFILIQREPKDRPYRLVYLQATDAGLGNVWKAVHHLFSRDGLKELLWDWLWIRKKQRSPRFHRLLMGGWSLTLVSLLYWLCGPVPPDLRLEVTLSALVLFAPVMTLSVTLGANGPVVWWAWRQGREWGRSLTESQVCVLFRDNAAGQIEHAHGESAGVPLYRGTLLALRKRCPVSVQQSWLWWTLVDGLASNLSTSVSTGAVLPTGQIDQVDLPPHIQVVLPYPHLTDMVTPDQPEAYLPVGQRVHPLPELRLRPTRHMRDDLMWMGGLAEKGAWRFNTFCLAIVLLIMLSLPSIYHLLWPPPRPRLNVAKCGMGHPPLPKAGNQLQLSFFTPPGETYRVLLVSGFWSTCDIRLDGDARHLEVTLVLPLTKQEPPHVIDKYDGTLRVLHERRFLWRRLPDVVLSEAELRPVVEK